MLALLSDLNSINKLEVTKPAVGVYSGVMRQGTFIAADGTAVDAKQAGYAIWNEDNGADNTWSPDVTATGQVSCLLGGYRCKTDQYTGTPVVGDALYINTNGVLAIATLGTHHVSAFCIEAAAADFAYKGSTYTVLHVHVV